MWERGATAREETWASQETRDSIEDDGATPRAPLRLAPPVGGGSAARAPLVAAPPEVAWRSRGGNAATAAAAPAAPAAASPGARRVPKKWTADEEALLIRLGSSIGKGRWSAIQEAGGAGFNPVRTQVDLKDKWRCLERAGRV